MCGIISVIAHAVVRNNSYSKANIEQRRYGDIITHKLLRYKLYHVFLEARVNSATIS